MLALHHQSIVCHGGVLFELYSDCNAEGQRRTRALAALTPPVAHGNERPLAADEWPGNEANFIALLRVNLSTMSICPTLHASPVLTISISFRFGLADILI